MTIGAISSSENSLMPFLPLLSGNVPSQSSGGASFADVLNRVLGFDHLQNQLRAALEQVKFENEQTLFSKRNQTSEDRAIDDLKGAAEALDFVRSTFTGNSSSALLSQANVPPTSGSQLLFGA